ncbi:MAG TPA: RNA polymerase subunit sigma-24 [Bacteroidetes bacterium]|nr:RNA polymerase subunit sigma-24 [Bacteroidota bacterium]
MEVNNLQEEENINKPNDFKAAGNPNFSIRAQEDYDLVKLAIKKDQSAYAKLMARYKDSIYFMVLKMVHNTDDADDLTIEAFGKAFSKLDKYSPDFAFSTWLYKIALNNSIDWIRKRRLETLSIDEQVENESGENYTIELKGHQPDPEEKYIRDQRARLMREVIEKLNPKYKMLIEMRFFDELSYEEIAEKTNLPLGTVKAQLFRAKDLLYQVLAPKKEKY